MSTFQKHLFNTPHDLVTDSLKGLCLLNPGIALDEKQKVIYNPSHPKGRVSIISGGGSGHEPAHAGFVGDGLLTAAVCGNVFASPNVGQIRRALDLVQGESGTLIVVKNYTGDVLHFGLACEKYRSEPGRKGDVRVVVVGDDVAVGRTQGGLVGRRGLAGTVLVYKIAAALARKGASLDKVEELANLISENIATIGIGLEHCHVPGTEKSESHLATDELELGMGIHNEPGFAELRPFPPVGQLVDKLLSMLTSTSDPERSFVPFANDGSDEVVLLVNNLGGISELELGGVAGEAISWLQSHKFKVKRALVGTFMTSLNMPGFSLTLLLLPPPQSTKTFTSNEIIQLLDEPADAPGWKWHAVSEPATLSKATTVGVEKEQVQVEEYYLAPADEQAFITAIERACHALIKAEPDITRQDTVGGDGDAGLTLKAGAEGVLKAIREGRLKASNTIDALRTVSEIVDEDMGGTSGGLYSIYFSGLARSLRDQAEATGAKVINAEIWIKATQDALDVLYKYTRARPPSRTLVDPLAAFVSALPTGFANAVTAAQNAAEETRKLAAKAGRSAYVDQKRLMESAEPDPGAWGVWVLLNGLLG